MIVPGFIVNRMYIKGSLRREGDGWHSFSFKPGTSHGTTILTGPGRVTLKNPLANLDLVSLPELYIDGQRIQPVDIRLFIDGEPVPGWDEEKAKRGEEQSREFTRDTRYKVMFRADLSDGRHAFKAVAQAKQFKELIVNFSDTLGEAKVPSLWQRFFSLFIGGTQSAGGAAESELVRETPFYILKDRRPDPDFGRVLAALQGKEPDRVPLLELFADQEVKDAFLQRPATEDRDEVEFHLAVGYDYVPIMLPFLGPRTMHLIDSHQTSYKQELQERAWVAESDGAIKTLEDFESYDWLELTDELFGDFEQVSAALPPEMKLVGCVSAVFETVTQAMGLEHFSFCLYDQPDLIEAMFKKADALVGQAICRMMEFDTVGAIWITDDLAYGKGPLISPAMLDRYVFPCYARYAQTVHEQGLPILLHSCGNTKPLFESILRAGFDALHPFEANSVDIYEAKKLIGDRICLVGNLDLSYMLTRGTPEEIEEDVKKHIRELAPGGGYCLSSSNSIANYVPMANFLAMNRACLTYGNYPISL